MYNIGTMIQVKWTYMIYERNITMNRLEQEMKVLCKKTEWAKNKPTMKERRNKKSNLTKISKILEHAAYHLESFESIDFINKHKNLSTIYNYFFPDALEVLEKHDVMKSDNLIYINFNRDK